VGGESVLSIVIAEVLELIWIQRQDLPNLVPQAKKLGTLSLPLPLLQYLGTNANTSSFPATTSNHNPTYNSTPSDAGVQSVKRSHELEEAYQDKLEQEEGPRAHDKDPAAAHETHHDAAVNEKDKSLLAELIPNPPGGGATVKEDPARSAQTKKSTGKASLPVVNCMNTPDCHWLPEDLLSYARDNGIELWAGGGGEGSGRSPSTLGETVIELTDSLSVSYRSQILYPPHTYTIPCKNSFPSFPRDC
jgi:hypothetical protein